MITKQDVLISEGKKVERVIRHGNAFTNLESCILRAGKYPVNAYTPEGVYIAYTSQDTNDQDECLDGLHLLPKYPIELN